MKTKNAILKTIKENKQLNKENLIKLLNIDKKDYSYFYNILNQMEKEGLIINTKNNKLMVNENIKKTYIGVLQGTRSGKFCYFICDDKEIPDVFIHKNDMGNAINKDKVEIELIYNGTETKSPEGKVLKVIEENTEDIVGTFEEVKSFGFVKPDDQKYGFDIFIGSGQKNGAKNDDKVIVRLKRNNKNKGKNIEGIIVKIIGNKKDKGVDISSIAYEFDLPFKFPKLALEQADKIKQFVSEDEIIKRKDLRNILTVTIDGSDAKDFDDAISIDKDNEDYILYVHIADVANYVTKGSFIDKEAYKRGNSVYLLDRVIPMLPTKLSNGICSLNPNVDRLTMTVKMRINKQGKVKDYKFYESVINSDHRLIYDDVSNFLDGKKDIYDDLELKNKLQSMEELFKILVEKRKIRGSIDFDFPESKIILNNKGQAIDVEKVERRVANKIIEEFMLVTNETVAEHFGYLEAPFIYRIHEEPTDEKITDFKKIIHNFGYRIKGKDIHSKDLQILLNEVKGKSEEQLISTLLLRSMKKAEYSDKSDIHFGLASNFYTHFTSPIRRYSDLFIHRILKQWMKGKLKIDNNKSYMNLIENTAKHCSETERKAESAEYEVEDMKKAEYMESKIGAIFNGTIVSLTKYGMYIQLENTIEGLVRYESIPGDYYKFNEEKYYVIGERTKKIFNLGQKVKVKVIDASADRREIDFIIIKNGEVND